VLQVASTVVVTGCRSAIEEALRASVESGAVVRWAWGNPWRSAVSGSLTCPFFLRREPCLTVYGEQDCRDQEIASGMSIESSKRRRTARPARP
jgi:hypothetical protein